MMHPLPPLIGLVGKKGSGKDTVARILKEEGDYTRLAFADALKDVLIRTDPVVDLPNFGEPTSLSALVDDLHWEGAKHVRDVRRMLQRLGVAIRGYDPDFWVRIVSNQATALLSEGTAVVISDVRFTNEASAITRAGGQLWRINRPGTEADTHISETELDRIETKHTLNNAGTIEHLRFIVRSLIPTRQLTTQY